MIKQEKLSILAPEMLEAIKSALRIKELWVLPNNVSQEFYEEAKALHMMLELFEEIITKAS